jgi:hypothetical protein
MIHQPSSEFFGNGYRPAYAGIYPKKFSAPILIALSRFWQVYSSLHAIFDGF